MTYLPQISLLLVSLMFFTMDIGNSAVGHTSILKDRVSTISQDLLSATSVSREKSNNFRRN